MSAHGWRWLAAEAEAAGEHDRAQRCHAQANRETMTDITRADARTLAICYEGFLNPHDDNAAAVWADMLRDIQDRTGIALIDRDLVIQCRAEALARLTRAATARALDLAAEALTPPRNAEEAAALAAIAQVQP